ncbi:membrane protein insertase YidC [Sporolactobacillus shoreicorticis]|uniref:Membrane protein insertase YidC n=1 Tax=Sporolactobacillus shoreicorticis TaxID=1923877 RepID=A0ABW5S695_9BACL|nr:membrane protein insertase YidC [Sporolactobacillus shoreicorticis]MCO7126646.1 membrane protein insertase YidC [Sporolactobacillus shoreicorticis]
MNTFIEPFTLMIQGTASFLGNSYGAAIIVLTLLIRFLLAPLMVRQYVRQFEVKKKMDKLKPELTAIQKRLSETKDPAEKQKVQMEMMGLYKKHDVNPFSAIGCLPIIVQMPILMGFYYAIRSSHEIATHHFLWFSLGHTDFVLTIIAGVVYFLQFKISQKLIPTVGDTEQQKSFQWIGLMSPIMIVFASLSTSAALPLYWVVGGLFLIGQTYFSHMLLQRMKKQEPEISKA